MMYKPNERGFTHNRITGHTVHLQGHRAECFDCGKVWTKTNNPSVELEPPISPESTAKEDNPND